MRLDKYLKISRLIKRRTVAKEASNDSKVLVNGKIVKVKVLDLNQNAKKQDADNMYEVISVTDNNS